MSIFWNVAGLATFAALVAAPAAAQILKCIDGSGNVTYQNEPCPKNEKSGRVDIEPAARVVLDRHHEGVDVKAVDDAADDVGGAVAEEERRENLELVIGLEHERSREARPERAE